MIKPVQSGVYLEGEHPNADQVSAFVEHALPPHERRKVLGHLGGCSRCRKIVALSLPPFQVPPDDDPYVVISRRFTRRDWAWIAVPTLAVLLVLIFHLKKPSSNLSRESQTTQILATHLASRQANQPPRSEPAAAKPLSDLRPSPSSSLNTREPGPSENEAVRNLSSKSAHDQTEVRPEALMHPIGHLSQATQIVAGMDRGSGTEGRQQADAPAAALPSRGQLAFRLAPPAPETDSSATPDSQEAASKSAVASEAALPSTYTVRRNFPVIPHTRLPSGLSIVSTAANLLQRLAIDSANQLYSSNDGGAHWMAVSPPWQGGAVSVAVEVRRPTPVASHSQPIAFAAPERYTPGGSAAVEADLVSNSLSGLITDASGAAVPRVSIDLTDSRTAFVRTVETDGKGRYQVASFVPGLYRIDVRAGGFPKQSLLVDLTSSSTAVRDITLTTSKPAELVGVSASTQPESPKMRRSPSTELQQPVISLSPSKPPGTAVFVVTTDAGDRWISPNGQDWKLE